MNELIIPLFIIQLLTMALVIYRTRNQPKVDSWATRSTVEGALANRRIDESLVVTTFSNGSFKATVGRDPGLTDDMLKQRVVEQERRYAQQADARREHALVSADHLRTYYNVD